MSPFFLCVYALLKNIWHMTKVWRPLNSNNESNRHLLVQSEQWKHQNHSYVIQAGNQVTNFSGKALLVYRKFLELRHVWVRAKTYSEAFKTRTVWLRIWKRTKEFPCTPVVIKRYFRETFSNWSNHPEVLLRKGVLKICNKFKGKHLDFFPATFLFSRTIKSLQTLNSKWFILKVFICLTHFYDPSTRD